MILSLYTSRQVRGFTLIELTISLLILSALGLAFSSYLRKNNASMTSSDASTDLTDSAMLIQKLLSDDIRQAANVHPGCGGTPSSSTTACTDIKVRGGVVPLPGYTQANAEAATNTLTLPSSLTSATSSLTNVTDGLRVVQFNFSDTFNCKLNSYRTNNPSVTSGTATGAERLWPLRSGCSGKLTANGLYLLVESIGGIVYSNVFQITAITDLGGGSTSVDQLQVDAISEGNMFNQEGGLGLSGFSAAARIFPIKIVEWAHGDTQGLYRREIIPTTSSIHGYGAWNLLSTAVEGIQFYPVTVTTTAVVEHQRTMQFTADTNNDGVEDIRGVSPRLVIKSAQATSDATTYDNPLTDVDEADHFPRKEIKFYVDMQNSHTN